MEQITLNKDLAQFLLTSTMSQFSLSSIEDWKMQIQDKTEKVLKENHTVESIHHELNEMVKLMGFQQQVVELNQKLNQSSNVVNVEVREFYDYYTSGKGRHLMNDITDAYVESQVFRIPDDQVDDVIIQVDKVDLNKSSSLLYDDNGELIHKAPKQSVRMAIWKFMDHISRISWNETEVTMRIYDIQEAIKAYYKRRAEHA